MATHAKPTTPVYDTLGFGIMGKEMGKKKKRRRKKTIIMIPHRQSRTGGQNSLGADQVRPSLYLMDTKRSVGTWPWERQKRKTEKTYPHHYST